LLLSVLAQSSDEGPTPAQQLVTRTVEREYVDELWEDGRYQRFGTKDKGPVHVWRPRTYRRDTAETVVYLHGFYTDVDHAILEHQLLTQFRDSGKNALFIVPETRSWRTDPFFWNDLEELLATVEKRTKQKRPAGPITVVGHSGGYRTVVEWLKHASLGRVVLVDGMYGNDDEFKKWVDEDKGKDGTPEVKQLVLVGFDTVQHTEWFLRKQPTAIRLDDLPYLYDDLPSSMAKSKVLYFQSERFDHMAMVTSGRLLPWLLHVLH
jgi:pimeloyl-ACP methyl ester carboxylesterase